jgi:hypothetical protein
MKSWKNTRIINKFVHILKIVGIIKDGKRLGLSLDGCFHMGMWTLQILLRDIGNTSNIQLLKEE